MCLIKGDRIKDFCLIKGEGNNNILQRDEKNLN